MIAGIAPGSTPIWRIALLSFGAIALLALWTLSPLRAVAVILGLVVLVAVLRFPLVGLGLLAFTVPWGSVVSGGTLTPTEPLVLLVAGAWLARSAYERRNPLAHAPWLPYLLLFLAVIALSATQAHDLAASGREVLKWAELTVVYLAASSIIRDDRAKLCVLGAVVLAGLSEAALGILQTAASHGPAAFAAERALLRAYGTFDQPNPYAGYLNMILPVALAFALLGPQRWRRWAWWSFATLALAVLASESRGALLAGLAAVAVLTSMMSVVARRVVFLAVVLGLIGLLLVAFGLQISPLQQLLNAIGLGSVSFDTVNNANFSAVERAAHWLAGVRMFAAHPLLGVGIGNYAAAYPVYHPRGWYASLDHAHNYYINIAAEGGIAGLVAYVLLVGAALWYSVAAWRVAPGAVDRAAGLGLTGALVATNFHNIFDVLYVHGTTVLIGLLMAAGLTVRAAAPPATRPAIDQS